MIWLHEESSQGVNDYKIHCFNGEPKITLVCSDRFSERGLREDFFDADWQHLPMCRPTHPNADVALPRPQHYDEMKRLAARLSEGIPFVRVDFYEVAGTVYFSELTFFPSSGMEHFVPDTWDSTLGNFLLLPQRKQN